MADDTITLVLDGEVEIADFEQAIDALSRLVRGLSAELTSDAGLRWLLEELSVGSAIVTLRGEAEAPEAIRRVANAYIDVGRALHSYEPVRYSPEVAGAAANLQKLAMSARVVAVRFETSIAEVDIRPVSDAVVMPLTPRSRKPSPTLGSVEGFVQMVSNRRGLRFTLYDTTFDKAVSCYLAEGHEDLLRFAWVVAWWSTAWLPAMRTPVGQ